MDVVHMNALATQTMDVEHDDEMAVHEPAKDEPTDAAPKANPYLEHFHIP